MENSHDKKYGRTMFDLIAEHPKPTFFIFLTILVVAISLIFLDIPFKVGNVEIGENKAAMHDTVVIVKHDTNAISPTTTIRLKDKEQTKKLSVKIGDTIITANNIPANINTGTNNGVIGNNNDINVSVGEKQRKLNEPSKRQLLAMIYQVVKDKNILDTCVQISAIMGNGEALTFANEILQFLKTQHINASNDIGQFQTVPVVKGVQVGVDRFARNTKKCVEINVGYK